MNDEHLNDDMVKLVRYSIVCIAREDRENPKGPKVLVCNECKVFSDNMTDCDFDSWVIADYVGKHKVFCDKKDLRVAHQVLGRWPQRSLHYEEKQLRRLAGIETAIRSLRDAPPPRIAEHSTVAPDEEKPAPEAPKPEPPELDEESRQALTALADLDGEAPIGKLAAATGLARKALREKLAQLIELGLVERVGEGLKTRYRLVAA